MKKQKTVIRKISFTLSQKGYSGAYQETLYALGYAMAVSKEVDHILALATLYKHIQKARH